MSRRNRSEAAWTHEEAVVKGKRNRNKAWVLFGLVVAAVFVITLTWQRVMDVADVTYELRHCQEPLTAESTWQQVQAAACDPVTTTEGTTMVVVSKNYAQDPEVTTDSSWTFEKVPVNSRETSMRLKTDEPVRSVVLAEPENERIRRALSPDAAAQDWSGYVGSRGPKTYWVLVTP